MPKKSCDEPDNCFPECVKCCVEKCKKICCERKYLKLAHKLLNSGLFVDTANYSRQETFAARTSSQFYVYTGYFALAFAEAESLEYNSTVVVNNQPNNLVSWGALGFDAIDLYSFTLAQLTSFNFLNGNATIVADPVIQLLFGLSLAPVTGVVSPTNPAYDTIQNGIISATPTATSIGKPALVAYLQSKITALIQILGEILPGGLPQVITAENTPYVNTVAYQQLNPTLLPPVVNNWVGKAALVSKSIGDSSPCSVGTQFYLAVSARTIVDRYGPLPGPCDF
jgi:hypothetical protein